MTSLIAIHENIPVVSHRVIAQSVGIEEKSILDLINRNFNDFQEFGTLAILNRVSR